MSLKIFDVAFRLAMICGSLFCFVALVFCIWGVITNPLQSVIYMIISGTAVIPAYFIFTEFLSAFGSDDVSA